MERTFDGVNGASTYALTPQEKDVTLTDVAIKGLENSAKGAVNNWSLDSVSFSSGQAQRWFTPSEVSNRIADSYSRR